MATLDENLALIDREMQRVQEDSARRLLQLKSERNSLLPVSKLPMEILTLIFQILSMLKTNYTVNCRQWDWLVLTRVCRYWRSIALDSPIMWTRIRFIRNEDKLRTFLERSQTATLSIGLGDEKERIKAKITPNTLEMLSKNMNRIQMLNVTLGSSEGWSALDTLFTRSQSLPKMKKMKLHVIPSSGLRTSTELTALNKTKLSLEALSLNGVYLPWNSTAFQGLVKLSLFNIKHDNQPTLSQLLDILETCPSLRKLGLFGAGPKHSVSQADEKRQIDLHYLRRFQISKTSITVCNNLFEYLHVPQDLNWSICCDNYPFEEPELLHPALLDSTVQCQKIFINLNDCQLTFKAVSQDNKDEIDQHSKFLMLNLEQYEPHFLQSTIDSIIISVGTIVGQKYWRNVESISFTLYGRSVYSVIGLLKKHIWTRLFSAIPHIHTLDIGLPVEHYVCLEEDVIDAFAEPANPDLLHNFHCPELINLRLIYFDFGSRSGRPVFRKLVNHLQHRNRSGRRLRSLEFSNCYGISPFLKELKELDIVDKMESNFN